MISYPNMIYEIIESINFLFKDDEDLKVECLLSLVGLQYDNKLSTYFSNAAKLELEKMDRCSKCGEKLKYYYYKEPHPELDRCPMEKMIEIYCPNCDI